MRFLYCKLVQIGGIVMFNNLFYYLNNFSIDFCLNMLSIIVLRKKIGIVKNLHRKIAIGASL